MTTPPESHRNNPLHLPTALGCLALQALFIGMCLYRNAVTHDFGGMLSTISFSSIFLATQALIGAIVCGRVVRWSGSFGNLWREGRMAIGLVVFCLAAAASLVRSPVLADRLLAFGNPVSLSADGSELRLTGSIPSNLPGDVKAVCANGACVAARTLVLSSDGGSFEGALEGLEALKAIGVERSVVDGSCESACVALWAGFDDAEVPPGSAIGIQGVYDPLTGQATARSLLQTQRLVELLLAHGFPPHAVAAATAYPFTRHYYLTGAEIGMMIQPARQP